MIDICNELTQNFLDFSYEANSSRAFADARDGLKPGQRACLWEMFSKGFLSNKPHVKSAKVSGSVIAEIWPHSNTAIYETFARMSQKWINNIPEVDFHGANGNIVIGNKPASERYTECRLAKSTEEGMFIGIKKKNVKFIPNFSEDMEWPEVLPSIFPRLLVNGAQGIGVTIANTWLPSNLREVTQVIKTYAKTGEIDYSIPLFDFPTGGIIINGNNLAAISKTGKGKVILRAKTEIKGKSILITEMPYQVFVEPLVGEIKDLIEKGELADIKDIHNKTDKKRLLIEIVCKSNPEHTLAELFTKTSLQKNYNANQFALVSKTPVLLNLKEYLDIYLDHNKNCISQECKFDLKKSEDRLEIVDGLLKALEDIDNIIKVIKSSKSSKDAQVNLCNTYGFSERQSKAIVDMRLGKLANLEKVEIENEAKELKSNISELMDILSSPKKIEEVLLKRLRDFTNKYGSERKTQIMNISIEPQKKEIVKEDVTYTLHADNSVTVQPSKNFSVKIQKRKGKGVKGKAKDVIISSLETDNTKSVFLFSNKGKFYKTTYEAVADGSFYNNIKDGTEKIINILDAESKDKSNIICCTKKGLVKKSSLSEYETSRKTGVVGIKLNEDDEVVSAYLCNDEKYCIVTSKGMCDILGGDVVKTTGRSTKGKAGIKLSDGDYVLKAFPIFNDEIAFMDSKGKGKRVKVSEFVVNEGRARQGKQIGSPDAAPIISAFDVNDSDVILLYDGTNVLYVNASDIKTASKSSKGITLNKTENLVYGGKI